MENALNYLGILLNDIEQSKNNLAAYNNLLLMIKAKYGNDIEQQKLIKSLSEQERQWVMQIVGLFRTYATRAYIAYTSIKSNLKTISLERNDLIEESYRTIRNEALPNYIKSETFVQALNDLFADEINVQALINQKQKSESLAQASETPNME